MEELEGERLKTDIHTIKNTLTSFGMKLELVYAALTGNEITRDEGLVGEVKKQREELEKIEARVETLEKLDNKKQIYTTLIFGAICFILAFLFDYFFKK